MDDRRSKPVNKGMVDVRRRLIETAAHHFARHGFEAASQRAIQRDAGANPAAAHYYFGSKAAMYRAVVDTFIHDIQAERIQRHQAIPDSLSGADRLHRLLLDYFEPAIATATTVHGLDYARMNARVQGEFGSESQAIFTEIARPTRIVYLESLHRLFPDATMSAIEDNLVRGLSLMALTAVRGDPDALTAVDCPRETANELARFVAAGFQALLGPVRS